MNTTRVELSDVFCRVGKTYCKFSAPGKVCKPVEGTITTECAVEGCKRFC